MSRRPSARTLLTGFTVAVASSIVVLLSGVVREALVDSYALAIPDTMAAIWTIGILLIVLSGIAAWLLSQRLLEPLSAIRRNLTLSARTRAIAEPHLTEVQEISALRATTRAVLEELETRLREAELAHRRVLELFEITSEGILQMDRSGRFLHVNAAARALLRLPPLPEGQSASSIVRNPELRDLFETASRGEPVAPTEIVLDTQHLFVAPVPLVSETGENSGALVTVVDLTELRRLESVRRDFVANVSHELKTPLTSIRGYAETLLADDVPADAQSQFLTIIHKNATRLQRMVEELLDLSRLQSGGWDPQLDTVDAAALAREVWLSCQPAAEKKRLHFEIDGAALLTADRDGLRQVLSNLLENAVRYTPDEGHIDVVLKRTGSGMIDLAVRDDGAGIPADSLPRIFERFYRVDPARSREEGGTGLGLAIVKHFVEGMGGTVFAESEAGKGTTIHVRLPSAA